MAKNEQRFYSALKDIFIGEEIQGKSGYVNLMNIKKQYFDKIQYFIGEEVTKTIEFDAREELYEKLYTFFDSYFNETGTVFFSNTQIHKNIYERVYSDREDVSLFWKTQKLYYVKTESNYKSLDITLRDWKFVFDASNFEHQKNNEKKELEFYLICVNAEKKEIVFKVKYKKKQDYDTLRAYLGLKSTDDVKKYLKDNFPDKIKNANVFLNTNDLNMSLFKENDILKLLTIEKNDDLIKSVTIEFAISGTENISYYLQKQDKCHCFFKPEEIENAFRLYKKQNEIDYFIHKDAVNFLREQFNIYLYNYLFNDKDLNTVFNEKRMKQIQNIKNIAYKVIDYLGNFEDELKAIWNKPKFVRKANYVFTLSKLGNNYELIEKIVNDKGFELQKEEWKQLYNKTVNDEGEEIKKVWKDFEYAVNFDKTTLFEKDITGVNLNQKYKYLPIDTKYFPELKYEILSAFENLEDEIDGVLIKSDNYQALNTILPKYKEKIDLIYIDPPFNTGSDFDYIDKFQDSTWLTLMENRLYLSKKLLENKGNLYLHLDFNADFLGRFLLNNTFGFNNFNNEIIWYYSNKIPDTRKNQFTNSFDIIYSYSKNSEDRIFNWLFEHREKAIKVSLMKKQNGKKIYLKDENGNGLYETRTERTMDNVWQLPLLHAQPEIIHFKTQKSEELLSRIIGSSSNENSIVLDYFSGSGTTFAAAHKLNRKWIGVEINGYFYDIIIPRMKKVLSGDKAGISDAVNWQGGGFFKYYELEQYEDALQIAKFNPKGDDLTNINFATSEKLLDSVTIDYEKEKAFYNFEALYSDIDIAETISNITGWGIKKIFKDKAVFFDGHKDIEIIYSEMTYEQYPFLKPLIWWKSR